MICAPRIFWGTCCRCGQVGPCRRDDICSAAASSRFASSASKGKGFPDGQETPPHRTSRGHGLAAAAERWCNHRPRPRPLSYRPRSLETPLAGRCWQSSAWGPKTTTARQKQTCAARRPGDDTQAMSWSKRYYLLARAGHAALPCSIMLVAPLTHRTPLTHREAFQPTRFRRNSPCKNETRTASEESDS